MNIIYYALLIFVILYFSYINSIKYPEPFIGKIYRPHLRRIRRFNSGLYNNISNRLARFHRQTFS